MATNPYVENVKHLTGQIEAMAEQIDDDDCERLQDELIEFLGFHGLDEEDISLPNP